MGVAGRSNAFAISQKLGLPNYIIETAREQMSQETQNFEDLLSELEETRSRAEKEKQEADEQKRRLDEREKMLADKEKQLNTRRDEILRKANEDARDILADAKKEADEAISELRRSAAGKAENTADMAAMERTRSALRGKVSERSAALQYHTDVPKKGRLKPGQLMVGDRVRVLSMGLTGTVNTLPDKKGKLFVMCGIMRTQVQLDDLELIREDAMGNPIPKNGGGRGGSSLKKAFDTDSSMGGTGGRAAEMDFDRAKSISAELNLLGMTTDEAVMALDKYLDDARLSHLNKVRIVHGKGTGALRNAVQNYLRKQKWVKSYRAGDFGEGDAGVTVVEL
jgi:DNA mismatch repair protein MutS2